MNNSGLHIGFPGTESKQNEEDFMNEFDQLINSQPFFKEDKNQESIIFQGV